MESSHVWLLVSSPWPPLQNVFFDFWFRSHNAQSLLPKICTKSPTSRLVWQIDLRCLGLPGGFRGWPIQWNHTECCAADPCCHGSEIWARRGDPVAYRFVCLLFCLFVYQHNNSWTVAYMITKFSGHHPKLKRKAKFENGYIGIGGCWFNCSVRHHHNPTPPSRSQWTRPSCVVPRVRRLDLYRHAQVVRIRPWGSLVVRLAHVSVSYKADICYIFVIVFFQN